jgi:hypothetical protein
MADDPLPATYDFTVSLIEVLAWPEELVAVKVRT